MISQKEKSELILNYLKEVAADFSAFQRSTQLSCPTGCAKCCFNPQLVCNPMELLPLAFFLQQEGKALEILEKAKNNLGQFCVLLEITDQDKGLGRCSQYHFRPFVCRVFAVAGRRNKEGGVELSVCKTLKENPIFESPTYKQISHGDVPLIEVYKKRLESLDPSLATEELPINKALVIALEKVLLWSSYN